MAAATPHMEQCTLLRKVGEYDWTEHRARMNSCQRGRKFSAPCTAEASPKPDHIAAGLLLPDNFQKAGRPFVFAVKS